MALVWKDCHLFLLSINFLAARRTYHVAAITLHARNGKRVFVLRRQQVQRVLLRCAKNYTKVKHETNSPRQTYAVMWFLDQTERKTATTEKNTKCEEHTCCRTRKYSCASSKPSLTKFKGRSSSQREHISSSTSLSVDGVGWNGPKGSSEKLLDNRRFYDSNK